VGRISSRAWAVSGLGLLLILVAEGIRASHSVGIAYWGVLWVAGWICLVAGMGLAVSTRPGWAAAGVSLLGTVIAVALATQGQTASFVLFASLAVVGMAVVVGMTVLVSLGLPVAIRGQRAPASSVTFGLTGIGLIVLAGAFSLLGNGMPLGYVAFAYAIGMLGIALSFGALHLRDRDLA